MDNRIKSYIKKHHLLTLAVCIDNIPYCANCFYAFNEKEFSLIFTSDITTKHIKYALKNDKVAGTISKETKNVAKIQGIQFQGVFKKDINIEDREIFFKKFPFTKIKKLSLWSIKLDFIKFTDNTLGFGKKILWKID